MEIFENEPLFERGELVITPGALELLAKFQKDPNEFLDRHLHADWGDMCNEDKAENELSVKEGFRIFSSYNLSEEEKLWLITEADRSATTFLLPWEY